MTDDELRSGPPWTPVPVSRSTVRWRRICAVALVAIIAGVAVRPVWAAVEQPTDLTWRSVAFALAAVLAMAAGAGLVWPLAARPRLTHRQLRHGERVHPDAQRRAATRALRRGERLSPELADAAAYVVRRDDTHFAARLVPMVVPTYWPAAQTHQQWGLHGMALLVAAAWLAVLVGQRRRDTRWRRTAAPTAP